MVIIIIIINYCCDCDGDYDERRYEDVSQGFHVTPGLDEQFWGYKFNEIQIYKCNKLRQNPTIGVDEQLGLCKQDSHLSVARQYDCTKVKS